MRRPRKLRRKGKPKKEQMPKINKLGGRGENRQRECEQHGELIFWQQSGLSIQDWEALESFKSFQRPKYQTEDLFC
jgi:hypothetical protein